MSKKLEANIYISGDPTRARATLAGMLEGEGWRIESDESGWGGVAKKGNKVANIFLGAFAQYFELEYMFVTLPDGNVHLRLYRTGSGMAGGLIGWSRVRKKFEQIVAQVEATYQHAGVLLASQGE